MIGFQAERRDQTCSSFSLANADESSPRSDNQGIRNLKKPERRNDENGSLTDLQQKRTCGIRRLVLEYPGERDRGISDERAIHSRPSSTSFFNVFQSRGIRFPA